jgi:hypothetical protein
MRLGRLVSLAVVGVAAIAIPTVVARRRALRRLDDEDVRIRMGGLVGRGTVLDATRSGELDRSGRERVEVQLEALVPGRRRFRTTTTVWATTAQVDRLQPGRPVPIVADENDLSRILIDFGMDEPQSIAGLGPFAGGPGGEPAATRPRRVRKPKAAEPAADPEPGRGPG